MMRYVPIKEIYRRIPPTLFDSVRKEIGKMVEDGVIRERHSPYCSHVTIVTKKDGTPRICIDFRKLNLKTKKNAKEWLVYVDDIIVYSSSIGDQLQKLQNFFLQIYGK